MLTCLFYSVALALQKLKLMKSDPGQNLSIVLVQLENVEDKNENLYIEKLQNDNNFKTKHYVKSMFCKVITEICKS